MPDTEQRPSFILQVDMVMAVINSTLWIYRILLLDCVQCHQGLFCWFQARSWLVKMGLTVRASWFVTERWVVNTLRPRQDDRHFPDDIFKRIFLNENVWVSLKISLKFVPKVPINTIPALVQTMAWRRPGDKPLSEPMLFSLLTHICVNELNAMWCPYNMANFF